MGRLFNGIKNILFPSLCLCCNEYVPQQVPLCNRCRSALFPLGFSKISPRSIPAPLSAVKAFQRNLSLFSAFAYTPPIKELLHNFKYTVHQRYLCAYIVQLLKEAPAMPALEPGRYDALIPVPMHPSKLREREFNHALLVAEALADHARIAFAPHLLAVRKPYPLQSHLSAQERLHNPMDRFTLNDHAARAYAGKSFILYDDVFTTGSTVFSCINELLPLRPTKILILTFAKA